MIGSSWTALRRIDSFRIVQMSKQVSKKYSSMGHKIARLALLVPLTLASASCSKHQKLDEARVKAVLIELAKAEDALDERATCEAYGNDAKITLSTLERFEPYVFKKDELCEFSRSLFRRMKLEGMRSETTVSFDRISIAPDGLSADVEGKVSAVLIQRKGAKDLRDSQFSTTIELTDGTPKLTQTIQTEIR